jgi:hypothetical protein
MAMRGLRLKVGISPGPVIDYISPATARIMYRGRVMNWAARISHLATGGQVGPLRFTWEWLAYYHKRTKSWQIFVHPQTYCVSSSAPIIILKHPPRRWCF